MACVADLPQQKKNAAADPAAAARELRSFAQELYARAGVAAALVALQDAADRDVTLMLFAMWLGLSGRGGLAAPQMAAADRAVGLLRGQLITPLRTLRRRLKAFGDADIRQLREQIKAIEIEAELAALERLAQLAPPASPRDLAPRLAAAEANFVLYLGPAAAASAAADSIRNELRSFAAADFSCRPTARPNA